MVRVARGRADKARSCERDKALWLKFLVAKDASQMTTCLGVDDRGSGKMLRNWLGGAGFASNKEWP
jgi:hypothetical protein